MITVTTGLPGAGKTLHTLYSVKTQADKENRQVYYNGIPDLKIPGWLELDKPEEWFQLPPGSIIVLDECQRLFRPRGTGAQVPEYVAKLETHRHQGLDLFLIMQHPMLVDTNVRRLVGRHFHVQRTFGMNRATVHEFTELRQEPDKSREGSIRHEFSYPKEVFTWYKSAEVHTVKRRIPARLLFLLSVPLLIAALVWVLANWWGHKMEKKPAEQPQQQSGQISVSNTPNAVKPLTTAEYLQRQSPRIQGLAYTAPAYDKITEPKVAPMPYACIASASKCICYTQQSTRLDMDEGLCRQFAENGFFDFTRQDPAQASQQPSKSQSSQQPT